MSTNSPSWYIPGEGKKPVGPFTGNQIIESWRAGRLNEKTLCWQEGMAKWLPLAQVEPFAATIRSAAAKPNKGSIFHWLAVRLVVLVCFVGVGGILYIYWTEWSTIHKASALIAADNYEEGLTILRPFRDETYFYRGEAAYLSALAITRQFASAANIEDPNEDAMKEPKRQFHDLFQAGERWRERAKSDLAGIIASVPKKASDDLARSMAIATFLEELKLADAKQLAEELLARLKTSIENRQSPEDINAAIVKHILRLDPSQSSGIIATVLPEAGEMPVKFRARLPLLQHWANDQPPLAKPLASAMVERATDLKRTAKDQSAELVLDTAEETCPELGEQCAQKRLGWLKNDLDKKDYASVVRGLDRMRRNNYSAAVSAEAASLFVEVGQEASKFNPSLAQRAIDRAFQLQPDLGDSEPNVLLWINVHPGPSSEKLGQCRHFLTTFTTSEHLGRIQMEVIRDAVAVAGSGGAWNAKRYLDAAYTEATSLLEKDLPVKELEPQAWSLAQRLADTEQYDKAIQIAALFCKVFPETPLKQEIEGMAATWRAVPKSAPGVKVPGRGGRQETLEAKLLRRKRTINTSTAVSDAVANKEIWIIEVGDTCTADQFDAEQARLLRDWVSDGGVLWVNSNVLRLFGVRHGNSKCVGTDFECEPAGGNHPILENCTSVHLLNCADDRAYTLQYKGVIPLLTLRKLSGLGFGAPPRGSTVWSLVPYGKGWISDKKRLNLDRGDGVLFWGRFCQFCLHELPWPPPVDGGGKLPEEPSRQGSLSGTWQASTGARFRIEDDGKTITIDLVRSDSLRVLSGKLTRSDEKPDANSLTGTLIAAFAFAPKDYTIRVSATIEDDNHLHLRCENWPKFDRRTKKVTGKVVLNELWTRSNMAPLGHHRQ